MDSGVVEKIVSKLRDKDQLHWLKIVNNNQSANLSDLAKMLEERAKNENELAAFRPVKQTTYGLHHVDEKQMSDDDDEVMLMSNKCRCGKEQLRCSVCLSNNHFITECPRFLSMDVARRWQKVQDLNSAVLACAVGIE